ncbi:MAG: hypothetical protein GY773_18000 [Actinomycetia bacterium]|nr:hypothetical protein [Actinomycetes bacterium]
MATISRRQSRPNIWVLTSTNAEYNRLEALDNSVGRKIASSVCDSLGLGSFNQVDDDDPSSDWFTAHRDAEAQLTVLAEAIDDLLAPGNLGKMRALVAATKTAAPAKTELRRLFNEARANPAPTPASGAVKKAGG